MDADLMGFDILDEGKYLHRNSKNRKNEKHVYD